MLPVIALDVDGVLSPVVSEEELTSIGTWSIESWVRATSPGSFNLHAAQPVIDFFRELSLTDKAELMWQTSWMENAPLILGPDFNLPDWPILATHDEWRRPPVTKSGDEEWFKVAGIRRLLQDGRHVIWLDDDLKDERHTAAVRSLPLRENLLMISPKEKRGLEPKHLARIKEKLKEWETA